MAVNMDDATPDSGKTTADDLKRKQDFDDLQNETADRDVGRHSRFLNEGERTAEIKRKKRDEERAFRTQLERLMQDPVYRAKYVDVMDGLRKAEQTTDAALERIAQTIRALEQDIQDMEDRAARLPDGTLVFRDANGVVRRADGSAVEDHLVETILWTGSEPGFEDYVDARNRLNDIKDSQSEVERYRDDTLGSARDRLTDPDNPPSLDELDGIQDGFMAAMPDEVRNALPNEASPPQADLTNVSIPDLGSKL